MYNVNIIPTQNFLHQEKIVVSKDGGFGSCIVTIYHNAAAKIMLIDSVIVDETHRRMGIGRVIMTTAEELAKRYNVDCIELVVNDDNGIGQKFYDDLGYVPANKKQLRKILNIK
jgi:GNAT superfamily N-acetyltransferase